MNVNIHLCDCVTLGGEKKWDWEQNCVSAPYWRFYWNKRNGAFIRISGKRIELSPDSVYLMAPSTVYDSWTEAMTEHFYVHFSADAPLSDVSTGIFRLKNELLLSLAAETALCFLRNRESWDTDFRIRILLMKSLLSLPSGTVPIQKQYDPRISRAFEIINSDSSASNRSIAKQIGMSVNSFLALFKKEMGDSPQKWLRRKRLELACEKLHFSEMTIEEIAELCGFCDRYHFSRFFKQTYGVGPSLYRRQGRILQDTGRVRSG